MSAGIGIEIYEEWQKMPPVSCMNCKEVIDADYYQQFIFVCGEAIETKIQVCESCYKLINESAAET